MGLGINIFVGLILVVIGFIIRRYPMLLSGFNTLPKEEREKINVAGMPKNLGIIFIVMGLLIIVGSGVLWYINFSYIGLFESVILIGGSIVAVATQFYYMRGVSISKAQRWGTYAAGIFAIIIVGSCVYTGMPAKIEVTADSLVIKGAYGLTIAREDITGMEVRDELPPSIARTNGLSFSPYHKGHFQFQELGNVRLYLHTKTGPNLIIYSKGNKPVIIDRSSPEELNQLYEALK